MRGRLLAAGNWMMYSQYESSDHPLRQESRPAFTQTVHAVCFDCNHGWMKSLEDALSDVLTGMINGQDTRLTDEQQSLLGAWSLKTAMMLQIADLGYDGDLVSPKHHFAELYALKRALPADVTAWVARVDDQQNRIDFSADRLADGIGQDANTVPRPRYEPYFFTFRVKRLAIQIAGIDPNHPLRTHFLKNSVWDDFISTISPLGDGVWPPTLSLTFNAYGVFSSRFLRSP